MVINSYIAHSLNLPRNEFPEFIINYFSIFGQNHYYCTTVNFKLNDEW